jgi:hypothetical protein
MRRKILVVGTLLTLIPVVSVARAQTNLPVETRNAALRYWLAFADLQDPPADKGTQELLEKTASGESPWDEAKLGAILDQNDQAIQEMQRATKLPECDWGLEYSLGPRASIAYVPRARVLARLNTLDGMRMMGKGKTQAAVDAWLDGVRFSQHLAQGGTLILKLVAEMSLLANFDALTRAAQAGQFDDTQKHEIAVVVRPLPDDGFNWGEAMALEEAANEIAARGLQEAANPKAYYQEMTGKPAPPDFTIPGPRDFAAFRALMSAAEEDLRLPPDRARERLRQLQERAARLDPFFRQVVPSPVRINEARAKVEAARSKLLQVLAAS